jgi:hypothetical protein
MESREFKLKNPVKPIQGLDSYYISKSGIVYSTLHENRAFFYGGMYPIKPKESNRGYLEVGLWYRDANNKRKRKWIRLHQLVANHWIEKPADADTVTYEPNHINGNKKDNRAENLEWVTRSENAKHAVDVLNKRIYKRPVYFDGVYYESIKAMGDTLGIKSDSARAVLSKGATKYLGKELRYATDRK